MDWIVAVVNDGVILNSQVQEEVALTRQRIINSGRPAPGRKELVAAVTRRLVEHELQLQRARQVSRGVSSSQIDQVVGNILATNQISLEDLLRIEGTTTEKLRRRIREDIMVNEALERDNFDEIVLNQSEVNEALRSRLQNDNRREYLVARAVLRADQGNLANELRALGDDAFTTKAQEVSTVPGVSLGWRLPSDLPAGYAAVVGELVPGTNAQVLELGGALHVVRLVAKRLLVPGQTLNGKIRLKLLRAGPEAREALAAARNEIALGNQDFATVATALGGTVSVEEFAFADLPPTVGQGLRRRVGELDGPFAVADGYLLALVLNVQVELYGDEQVRQEMVSVLYERRLEEVRRKWIENLRSVGTIEILRDPS